jgi:replicative DNA helicase
MKSGQFHNGGGPVKLNPRLIFHEVRHLDILSAANEQSERAQRRPDQGVQRLKTEVQRFAQEWKGRPDRRSVPGTAAGIRTLDQFPRLFPRRIVRRQG